MNVECESFVVEYFLHMYRTGLKFEPKSCPNECVSGEYESFWVKNRHRLKISNFKSYPNECVSGEFESKLEVIAVAGSSPVTVGRWKIGLVQNVTKYHTNITQNST